jgi:hypothetical protein
VNGALALLDLTFALLAGALWWARPELGPWPLLLIVVGWTTRLDARPRSIYRFSALDAAVVLFGLGAAYGNGYTNRASRQLYGEWLAISGREQEAAAIWRTLDLNQGQLEARVWWYERVGERDKADAIGLAAKFAREQQR